MNCLKRPALIVILLLMISSYACTRQIPQAVRELAISALCDFPAFSGENMCQRVDITGIFVEDISDPNSKTNVKPKSWCIELSYIDFTGEIGSACVWLIGPSGQGEFKITRGPYYDVKCSGLP